MVGCLGKLYESVENLNDTYMQPKLNKDAPLKPRHAAIGSRTSTTDQILPLLTNDESYYIFLYTCCSCPRSILSNPYIIGVSYVTDDPMAICPKCGVKMSKQMTYVAPLAPAVTAEPSTGGDEGGFVRG